VGRGRDRGKTAVADRDIDDWRELCERDPEPLPQAVVDAVSELYAAGTNAYTDREWFDVPDISRRRSTRSTGCSRAQLCDCRHRRERPNPHDRRNAREPL